MNSAKIHSTAEVDNNVTIGRGTKIWHQAQIREGVVIGRECVIGKGVYIERSRIGNRCKIQNYACLYSTSIRSGVFIGPGAILTNDKNPRATNPNGTIKTSLDWKEQKTNIGNGASLGAGTIVLPGVTIGKYALIGAGSVVTSNIPPFSLAFGNPARIMGKVDKSGKIIERA